MRYNIVFRSVMFLTFAESKNKKVTMTVRRYVALKQNANVNHGRDTYLQVYREN